MAEQLYATGQVAEILGIPRARLINYIETGKLPDVESRFLNQRVFKKEDIENLKKLYKKFLDKTTKEKEAKAAKKAVKRKPGRPRKSKKD